MKHPLKKLAWRFGVAATDSSDEEEALRVLLKAVRAGGFYEPSPRCDGCDAVLGLGLCECSPSRDPARPQDEGEQPASALEQRDDSERAEYFSDERRRREGE